VETLFDGYRDKHDRDASHQEVDGALDPRWQVTADVRAVDHRDVPRYDSEDDRKESNHETKRPDPPYPLEHLFPLSSTLRVRP